jgi:hypothetical protein
VKSESRREGSIDMPLSAIWRRACAAGSTVGVDRSPVTGPGRHASCSRKSCGRPGRCLQLSLGRWPCDSFATRSGASDGPTKSSVASAEITCISALYGGVPLPMQRHSAPGDVDDERPMIRDCQLGRRAGIRGQLAVVGEDVVDLTVRSIGGEGRRRRERA